MLLSSTVEQWKILNNDSYIFNQKKLTIYISFISFCYFDLQNIKPTEHKSTPTQNDFFNLKLFPRKYGYASSIEKNIYYVIQNDAKLLPAIMIEKMEYR